jgi:hypothetical protein
MAYRSACSTGRDSKSARAWLLEVGAAMLVSAVLVAMVLPAFGAGRAGGGGGGGGGGGAGGRGGGEREARGEHRGDECDRDGG